MGNSYLFLFRQWSYFFRWSFLIKFNMSKKGPCVVFILKNSPIILQLGGSLSYVEKWWPAHSPMGSLFFFQPVSMRTAFCLAVRSFLLYIRIHPSLYIPLGWGCLLLDLLFDKLHSLMYSSRHSGSESNLQTYDFTSLYCKRNYSGELKHWWISFRENMTC